jgi:hypothetical protein
MPCADPGGRWIVGAAAKWLATGIGSALVALAVKAVWESPRPRLELARCELTSADTGEAVVQVPEELQARIRQHVYFPDLDPPVRASAIEAAIEEARLNHALHARWTGFLDELRQLAETQSPELSLASRRRAFLERLVSDRDAGDLDNFLRLMLDELEPELDPKYQRHPPGQERTRVSLPGVVYDLSELPESGDSLDGAERYVAHITNVMRRVYLYYEAPVVSRLLRIARDRCPALNQGADAITRDLQALLASASGARLNVELVVTNRGGRPLLLREVGLLRMYVPHERGEERDIISVPLRRAGTASGVVLVEGGKAVSLAFASEATLRSLITENAPILGGAAWQPGSDLEESRLFLLYKAQVSQLEADVTLARAGADPREAATGASDRQAFGLSVDDQVIASLIGDRRQAPR